MSPLGAVGTEWARERERDGCVVIVHHTGLPDSAVSNDLGTEKFPLPILVSG